ncbi:uncharacterized protein LOC110884089 isoform X3 [Helianthus annuus]|uniref:uncharacterized protein LOC110884089 isoform X3 n=1 Tax=Helianthus annuus TaxID=4232 RepID=UPI001652EF5A|nr:uncharacterized protein LOC110884089 isoform X3 [Helianthus annuus]XP_035834476.1 uncharacterized protein LOC110884089 isoform X3 [Helianthus annuus]
MQGLSNRRTGTTSINMESSCSHSVFTCVIESKCKEGQGFNCSEYLQADLLDIYCLSLLVNKFLCRNPYTIVHVLYIIETRRTTQRAGENTLICVKNQQCNENGHPFQIRSQKQKLSGAPGEHLSLSQLGVDTTAPTFAATGLLFTNRYQNYFLLPYKLCFVIFTATTRRDSHLELLSLVRIAFFHCSTQRRWQLSIIQETLSLLLRSLEEN